jgi:hypothetical protein
VKKSLERNMKLLTFSMDHVKASVEKIIHFINSSSYGKERMPFRDGIEERLMSITSLLTIARSGLNASQTCIQTTAHNIANVNTEGYAVQEAVLTEATPSPSAVGLLGTGSPSRRSRAT